ncbi:MULTISPECIES: hypothetical protein [Leptospira]|uniref:Uncharacterized protein n=2 Tax=Leptospira TaxID=171 RepID=A0A6N4PTV3_9LEPT|nr:MULTISPECIES: hypothetical protein [Leptospira]MCW7470031.1 hypothetical protein [Leptospira kanakyensis]MCW7481014.1 hypothetical protein [Leptospira kanakyensis]PJZ44678.1 hypothetical protein CH361_13550 [Leptospira brenneri]TGK47806.1 hypothetical protein EHQ11_17970 [Leptospira kanakyensis]TGK63194.1 hypothetical protein EHQ16_01660 [Leptospira kanakyensis]
MEWEKILRDAVKENSIKELYLRKVPSLKTCEDWNKVVEVGTVDHKTKYAYYKGGLVKYGERLFFVTQERLDAVSPFRKWDFKNKIKITDPELTVGEKK